MEQDVAVVIAIESPDGRLRRPSAARGSQQLLEFLDVEDQNTELVRLITF